MMSILIIYLIQYIDIYRIIIYILTSDLLYITSIKHIYIIKSMGKRNSIILKILVSFLEYENTALTLPESMVALLWI